MIKMFGSSYGGNAGFNNGFTYHAIANYSRLLRLFLPTALLLVAVLYLTYQPPSQLQRYLPESYSFGADSAKPGSPKSWFIGTISPAYGVMRRQIIRETWQKLYKHHDIYTARFILSNPGEVWRPWIERENATYGDIIVLEHLEENADVANSIKSIEFLKYMVDHNMQYDFITKLDDDSFLDPVTFYNQYLVPVLTRQDKTIEPRTIWGRKTKDYVQEIYNFPYPGGQFYTMSWDIVKLLAKLYTQKPPNEKYEDVLIGRLLHEAREEWFFAELSNREAFDFEYPENSNKDGTVWAKPGTDLDAYEHPIGDGSINPHKLKDDTLFLKVAACYGPNGLLKTKTEDEYF